MSDSNSSEDEEAASPQRRPAQPGQRVAHKPNAIVAASRSRVPVESRTQARKPQRSKYQSSGDETSNSDDDSRRWLIITFVNSRLLNNLELVLIVFTLTVLISIEV